MFVRDADEFNKKVESLSFQIKAMEDNIKQLTDLRNKADSDIMAAESKKVEIIMSLSKAITDHYIKPSERQEALPSSPRPE